MGWGTSFTSDIYLNRITFSSVYEIKEKILELKEEIITLKNSIYIIAGSTPKDICLSDEDDIVSKTSYEVKGILDSIDEKNIELFQTELFLEFIENGNKNPADYC